MVNNIKYFFSYVKGLLFPEPIADTTEYEPMEKQIWDHTSEHVWTDTDSMVETMNVALQKIMNQSNREEILQIMYEKSEKMFITKAKKYVSEHKGEVK